MCAKRFRLSLIVIPLLLAFLYLGQPSRPFLIDRAEKNHTNLGRLTLTEIAIYSNFPIIPELETLLQSVADTDRNVILAISDSTYFHFVDNWLLVAATRNLSVWHHVIGLSLDSQAHELFQKQGIPTISASDWFIDLYQDDTYHRCDALKAYFALLALDLGYNVLVCDMDAFVVRDPFPLLCRDADIEVLGDVHTGPLPYGKKPGINAGVWYARSSDRPECHAQMLLSRWLQKLLANPHGFGQDLLNDVVWDHANIIASAEHPDNITRETQNSGEGMRACGHGSVWSSNSQNLANVRVAHPHVFCFEGSVLRNYSTSPAIVHVSTYKTYTTAALGFDERTWPAKVLNGDSAILMYEQAQAKTLEESRQQLAKAMVLAKASNRQLLLPHFDCKFYPAHDDIFLTKETCDIVMFFNLDHLHEVFSMYHLLPPRLRIELANEIPLETQLPANETLDKLASKLTWNDALIVNVGMLENVTMGTQEIEYETMLEHLTPSWAFFNNNWTLWDRYGFTVPGMKKGSHAQNCTWRQGVWSCGRDCDVMLMAPLGSQQSTASAHDCIWYE